MNTWITWMFLISTLGSLTGLLWPRIVARFKEGPGPRYYFEPATPRAGAGGWIVFLVIAAVIGAVLAALGFAAFLGDEEHRKGLKDAGAVAWFAAFTYGFGSASAIEEPLKR